MNKVYLNNEDCTITMERMKKDNLSIDLILTSPPNNMTQRKGGYADTGRYDIYTDWMSEDDYIKWSVKVFHEFDNILVKNGVILYNFSYSIENPTLPYKLITELVSKTNFCLADTIIWKKKSGLPFPANERRLSRNWEFVFVIVRKSEINTFNAYKGVASISEKTGQKYYNVYYNLIEAKNNDEKTPKLNQATFSSELVIKLLDIYGTDGIKIYDPFNGTGTTGAAACAIYNDITYYGSEISNAQIDYSLERIKCINETKFNSK